MVVERGIYRCFFRIYELRNTFCLRIPVCELMIVAKGRGDKRDIVETFQSFKMYTLFVYVYISRYKFKIFVLDMHML